MVIGVGQIKCRGGMTGRECVQHTIYTYTNMSWVVFLLYNEYRNNEESHNAKDMLLG